MACLSPSEESVAADVYKMVMTIVDSTTENTVRAKSAPSPKIILETADYFEVENVAWTSVRQIL